MDTEQFGVTQTVDLKPNGRNIPVTDDNKLEYVHLICLSKLTGSIRDQVIRKIKFVKYLTKMDIFFMKIDIFTENRYF